MWLDVLFIGIIIVAVLAILFFVFFIKKPYSWKKKTKGDRTIFVFEPRRDIKAIELKVGQEKEAMSFRRRNLRKGERVEFVYAASSQPAQLVIEDDGGRKTYEV